MMPDYVTPFTSWGVTPTLSDGSNLLAMSYMAGGQMAYMPQTQYLTPAVYGAYRTIPMASSTAQPQASQHTGILQSYLAYNRGALPFMAPYTVNTYNPVADQQAVFSLATSSATSLTMSPVLRRGGSTTFRILSRGLTSTPRVSGETVSIGFFLAFMILGKEV